MISISARSLLTAALLLNCGVTCAAPYLTVDTSASVGDGYYQTGYDADTVYRAASGPVEVASSTSYSGSAWPSGTINSTSLAQARADYGALRIYGYNTGVGGANAGAIFSDDWRISNPALDGTWGDLYVTVSVHGLLAGTADAQILLGEECLASGSGCRLLITTSGTTVGEFGFPIHFLYGTPFNIIINLSGSARAGGLTGSTLDLWSTAWISGLRLLDTAGGSVTDYTLTAVSGHDYGFGAREGSGIPVPAPLVLMAAAAAPLVLARLRAARQR